MNDAVERVYTPTVIEDTPFPLQGEAALVTENPVEGKEGNKTYGPSQLSETPLPTKRIAHELLSQAINTRSKKILQPFQFTKSGALQIGDYTEGEHGDIKISPGGIVARDRTGQETIVVDGETGDVFITGTFRSRSTISGSIIVGNSDIIIDGENRRMVFYDEDTGLPVIVIGNV